MLDFIQVLIAGLTQGGVLACVALGYSLIFRVSGVVNLAQGAFVILGAMAMYFFQVKFQLPVWAALPLGVLVCTVFAVAVGYLTLVPGVARLPMSSVLMLTAGLLTFFEGVTLLLWGNDTYALPSFSGVEPISIGAVRVQTQAVWLFGGIVIMIGALWWFMNRTSLGTALRACAQNAFAAQLMGIRVARMMVLSLALAAAIGSLSGILVAPIISAQFDTGRMFTTFGFVAVAVGGFGSFGGAILGGLLIGVTNSLAAFYVSSLFANTLVLAVLLGMLVWRPHGILAGGGPRRADVREELRVNRAIVRLSNMRTALLAVAFLALMAVLPLFPLPSAIKNSLTIGMILFIAVIGLDVLMGYAGQVNLGQAGFMAVGGYTAGILAVTYGWEPLPAMLAGVALSVACALVLSVITGKLRGHYLALATLAFGMLVDSLTVGLVDLTGGPSGLAGIPSFSVGSFTFRTSNQMYWLALGIAVAVILMLEGGLRHRFGRGLGAVRSDQLAAAALGVNTARAKVLALCISAALGAVSGSLYAFQFHFLSPEMVASPKSFELIAMLVLGGEGTMVGGLLGSMIMTALPLLLQSFEYFKTMIEGLILVMTFLFLPAGLFGKAAIWLEMLGTRRRAAKEVAA